MHFYRNHFCACQSVKLLTHEINFRHQQLSQENASKEILAAFKQSDRAKRGFITAQELRQILTTTGEKVKNSIIFPSK